MISNFPELIFLTEIVGFVCRTKTMHRLLCSNRKFLDHFVFTLGRYLFLLVWSSLFNVDVRYCYIYLIDYSCSLECIEKKHS